jgi:hypothetical protein
MSSARGDASARITVALPNGTPLNDAPLQDGYIGLAAIKSGTIKLTIKDVRQHSPLVYTSGSQASYVNALALLGDIDVPLDGFVMYQGSYNSDW